MKIEVIKNIKFDTFKDFFDVVFPLSPSIDLSGYIFRGVSSSKYDLLPKVLRKDRGNLWKWENKNDIDEFESTQVMREMSLLGDFYRLANNSGLRIPNHSILRYFDQTGGFDFLYTWMSAEFEETAALAQHYGIPTRLLDWTRDIFTAIYFASIGAMQNINKRAIDLNEYLAIYALNYNELSEQITYSKGIEKDNIFNTKTLPMKFVIPDYSENKNANAQKGLFTYSIRHIEKDTSKIYDAKSKDNIIRSLWASNKVDYTPLDKELQSLVDLDIQSSLIVYENIVFIYKFEIPAAEAIFMYDYISKFGYSYSSLFPGYASIKKIWKKKNVLNQSAIT